MGSILIFSFAFICGIYYLFQVIFRKRKLGEGDEFETGGSFLLLLIFFMFGSISLVMKIFGEFLSSLPKIVTILIAIALITISFYLASLISYGKNKK